MARFLVTTLFALVATPAIASAGMAMPVKGAMIRSAGGAQLAPVYRVAVDGSPQIILDGRLLTIPAATLSSPGGKLRTSLSKREVAALE